jgi:hypothetical protein
MSKKFIKNIIYSKSHIKINLLFSKDYKNFDFNSFGEKNKCAPQGAQKTKGKIHKEFSPSNPDFLVRNLRNGSKPEIF